MTMTNETDGGRRRGVSPGRIAGWGMVAAALLAPAVAMQVGGDVDWTASDFLFAAVLLIGGGLLIELVVWKAKSRALRIAAALTVVAVVLLVWADGAVGIF
jgi:uncharacterized membrane protein